MHVRMKKFTFLFTICKISSWEFDDKVIYHNPSSPGLPVNPLYVFNHDQIIHNKNQWSTCHSNSKCEPVTTAWHHHFASQWCQRASYKMLAIKHTGKLNPTNHIHILIKNKCNATGAQWLWIILTSLEILNHRLHYV